MLEKAPALLAALNLLELHLQVMLLSLINDSTAYQQDASHVRSKAKCGVANSGNLGARIPKFVLYQAKFSMHNQNVWCFEIVFKPRDV